MEKKGIRFCFIKRICTIKVPLDYLFFLFLFFSWSSQISATTVILWFFFPGLNDGLGVPTAIAFTSTSQYDCENWGRKFGRPNIFLSALQPVTWILTPTQPVLLCAWEEKCLLYHQMRALAHALRTGLPNRSRSIKQKTKYPIIQLAAIFLCPDGNQDTNIEVPKSSSYSCTLGQAPHSVSGTSCPFASAGSL